MGPKHCENSEVFPAESVAVAVMNVPGGRETGKIALKLELPSGFVVTSREPRNVWPSP